MNVESSTRPTRTARSPRAFIGHFLEMVLVMFIGMGVFSGLAALLFRAAGGSMSDPPGAIRVILMGLYMTVPMVIWMALRGHSRQRNAEMAAAMLVPTVAAAALVWPGGLDTMAGLVIQHVVMIPAMLGVMLWRYAEYAQPHHHHEESAS